MSPIANILVGALILFFGRRLYWMFVAAVGFVAGANLATTYLSSQPTAVILGVAIGLGLIGAIASLFLQKIVLLIAGALSGAYLGHMAVLTGHVPLPEWAGYAAGAVIGLLLVMLVFNWALVLLSSLTGATVIVENMSMSDRAVTTVIFYVILFLGFIVQFRQMTDRPAAEPKKSDK